MSAEQEFRSYREWRTGVLVEQECPSHTTLRRVASPISDLA